MKNSHIVPTRPNKNSHNYNPDIIILGADICYGMKSYGPQALLKIQNKTLIEHQLEVIKEVFPKSEVILVTGFGSSRVIKRCPKTVRIIENQLYHQTNETEQLRLALNCSLSNSAIIMTDGLLFNKETLLQFQPNNTSLLYDSNNQISKTDVGVNLVNNYVVSISYESNNKWCHILHLTNKEYKIIQDLCKEDENKRLFLHEILNKVIEKNKIVGIEPKGMKITKINNSQTLANIQ